jgi:hypothetical protein
MCYYWPNKSKVVEVHGMNPQKARMIVWTIFLLALVISVIGLLFDSDFLVVIGVIVIICDLIFHIIFYRCPHCGRYLDRNTGDYCPYCGKEVNR